MLGPSLQVLYNCSDECPHCKKSVDSRAHRVFDCPAFERVRWHYRDIFMVCGPSRQAWVSRCAVPFKVCFFTDGSCLFPAVPDIRVAAAAVVKPAGSGVFEPVWSGLLPTSNQTIQRAEVLAGAIATASALNPGWSFRAVCTLSALQGVSCPVGTLGLCPGSLLKTMTFGNSFERPLVIVSRLSRLSSFGPRLIGPLRGWMALICYLLRAMMLRMPWLEHV